MSRTNTGIPFIFVTNEEKKSFIIFTADVNIECTELLQSTTETIQSLSLSCIPLKGCLLTLLTNLNHGMARLAAEKQSSLFFTLLRKKKKSLIKLTLKILR